MPWKLVQNPDKSWSVINIETGRKVSKKSTKAKAEAQLRLLRGIQHKEQTGRKKVKNMKCNCKENKGKKKKKCSCS